jgi:hypothetical protein
MATDKALMQDALTDLDLYRACVINNDIPAAIKGGSHYLAALGLSTFTEVFGGLFRGDLKDGNSRKNYDTFIKEFFPKPYTAVDSSLHRGGLKGLYGAIRCGLVHEYLLQQNFIVVMESCDQLDCGIVYTPKKDKKVYELKFVVNQYFQDFRTAFGKYYARVGKDPYLVAKLECALSSIESPLPRRKSFRFRKK